MLEYKIVGKIFPRENTADKALLWPVMEKLNISHSAQAGKLRLSPLLKFGICAWPLHCKGSLWHLLPVPVKNGPLPLFSKAVVCCGYKLMPGKNKKGETDIRKMRCNSSCLRKGSSAQCKGCLEGVAAKSSSHAHFMHSSAFTAVKSFGAQLCSSVSTQRQQRSDKPFSSSGLTLKWPVLALPSLSKGRTFWHPAGCHSHPSLHTIQFCFLPLQNPSQDERSETRRKCRGSLFAAATKLCFKKLPGCVSVTSQRSELCRQTRTDAPQPVPVCQNEFKEKALNKQTY